MIVTKKNWETKDTASFHLKAEDSSYDSRYLPGQYLTVIAKIDNKDVPRSYSFSSTPGIDDFLRITVRRVQDGIMTNHLLDNVKDGDELFVTPITGEFYKPDDLKTENSNFHLFAAGSGITPIMSILKDILKNAKNSKVDLTYSNKSYENVIFKSQLLELCKEYSDRLQIHWFFTEDKGDMPALQQRLSGVSIFNLSQKKFFSFNEQNTFVYMCGPAGFMNAIEKYYKSSLPKCHLRKESFDIEDSFNQMSSEAKKASEKVLIGGQFKAIENSKIIAEIDGEVVEVECSSEESILDALLTAGENPPFSCMSGACMACMAVVEEGQVYQEDAGILIEENLKKNETLTCQARAMTSVVKIKYEDFL